jgi:HAD superfamily hydrolase (TIGR01549 family)
MRTEGPAGEGRAPPGRRFRLVLFDVGGTLVEDQDFNLYGEIAASVGIDAHPEAIAEAVRAANATLGPGDPPSGSVGYWQKVLATASAGEVGDAPVQRFAERLARLPRTGHLFSDVRRTLERLRAEGRRLGVVSNTRSDEGLRELLGSVGILRYFTVVMSAGRAGYAKPHPEIFRRAAREAGVESAEAFYVGDLPEVDVRAAERAGLGAVWLHRDGTGFGEEPPEITSLTELPRWIARLEAGSVK